LAQLDKEWAKQSRFDVKYTNIFNSITKFNLKQIFWKSCMKGARKCKTYSWRCQL